MTNARYQVQETDQDKLDAMALSLLKNINKVSELEKDEIEPHVHAINSYAYAGQRFTIDDGFKVLAALEERRIELANTLSEAELPDFVYRGSMENPEPRAPEPVIELELENSGR